MLALNSCIYAQDTSKGVDSGGGMMNWSGKGREGGVRSNLIQTVGEEGGVLSASGLIRKMAGVGVWGHRSVLSTSGSICIVPGVGVGGWYLVERGEGGG